MLNLKKWVVVVVVITYRSVWLLELLTEPINLYKNVGTTNFCPCFGRSKSGEGDQMRSVFKIMRCSKEQIWPQFSKHLFQNESVAYHRLWANADSFKHFIYRFFVWNEGQLRPPVAQPLAPLPPFTIHILSHLDMRIQQMASKIYQNYKKNVQIVIWRKFFFVFLHEITLEPIDHRLYKRPICHLRLIFFVWTPIKKRKTDLKSLIDNLKSRCVSKKYSKVFFKKKTKKRFFF